jgi:hypothetical protein
MARGDALLHSFLDLLLILGIIKPPNAPYGSFDKRDNEDVASRDQLEGFRPLAEMLVDERDLFKIGRDHSMARSKKESYSMTVWPGMR